MHNVKMIQEELANVESLRVAESNSVSQESMSFEGQGLTLSGGFIKVHINGIAYSHAMLVSRLRAADELDQIADMLDVGQGYFGNAQILPEFSPGMTVSAKVESCLHLIEDNRNLIEALSLTTQPITDEGPGDSEADDIVQRCAEFAREIIISDALYKPLEGEKKRTPDEVAAYVYNSLVNMKSRRNVLLTAKNNG